MEPSVQRLEGAYVPFEAFEKDYDTIDGQAVACGAYRDEDSAPVRACAAVRQDGSAVLPGYFDMVRFRGRERTYPTMLAPTPPSQVPGTAFVRIEEPSEEFVLRFEAAEAALAADYTHHRIDAIERALTAMRAWRSPASDRMLTRGVFDNFFQGLGIRRDESWRTVDEARGALGELLEEQRARARPEAPELAM